MSKRERDSLPWDDMRIFRHPDVGAATAEVSVIIGFGASGTYDS